MTPYHWILFDADHTLFDFDLASEEALSEVLIPHGVDWREGMYADYKKINVQCWMEHEQGIINRDTLVYERFRRYFDFMNLDLDPVSTQEKYLFHLSCKPYLMPGAETLISALSGNIGLGYITNGMTSVQRRRLEMIDWHKKFDVIVIAGEIGHSKPSFEYFDYVHQQIGYPQPENVLVVGDSLTADIEGAANYGYRTCWYNPNEDQCTIPVQPDYVIGHLEEVYAIVLRK